MLKFMLKWTLLFIAVYFVYKNRFRMINSILGFQLLRQIVAKCNNFFTDRWLFSDKTT